MLRSMSIVHGVACALVYLAAPLSAEEAPAPIIPVYADIAPIVEINCVGCHNSDFAYADVVLENEADLIKNRDSVTSAINSGFMPLGVPDFAGTDEGKALLAWLAAQKPVAPNNPE